MDQYHSRAPEVIETMLNVGYAFRSCSPSKTFISIICDLGFLEALSDLMKQDSCDLVAQAIWAMNEVIRSLDRIREDSIVDKILDMDVTKIVLNAMMHVLPADQFTPAISFLSYVCKISRTDREIVFESVPQDKLNEWLSHPCEELRTAAAELVKNLVFQKGMFSYGDSGEGAEFCKWIVMKFLENADVIDSRVYRLLLYAISLLADESKGFVEFLFKVQFHVYSQETIENTPDLDAETVENFLYILAAMANCKRNIGIDPNFLMRFATCDNLDVSVQALRVISALVELHENVLEFSRDDVLEAMKCALTNAPYCVKTEIHECIATMVMEEHGGTVAQKLARMGFIPIFTDLLPNIPESNQQEVLRTLELILRYGETSSAQNIMLSYFYESETLETLEQFISDDLLGPRAAEQAQDILRHVAEYSQEPVFDEY